MDQGNVTPITPIRHTSKSRIAQRASAGGVTFRKRNGQIAYIERNGPLALEYLPEIEGGMERINLRLGDSFVTVDGRNLRALFDDLQNGRCEAVRESDHGQAVLGALYIECITIRLFI
jgi:hypothetical protein